VNPSLRIARPGFDTRTAPDWALVFSSEWPSLQIAFEQTVTVPAGDSISFLVNHNLNFYPLTSVWWSINGLNLGRVSEYQISNSFISNLDFRTLSQDLTYTVRCYNVDISQEASYPLPTSAAAKTSPDLTTGIKIVKKGRSINSPNLNDFILNSQTQSPAVLQVATQSGPYFNATGGVNHNAGGTAIIYPLQTSYIPWVLGAVTSGSYKSPAIYNIFSPTDLNFNASTNSVILNFGAIGDGASLIILRDPLFYPNTVRVVF